MCFEKHTQVVHTLVQDQIGYNRVRGCQEEEWRGRGESKKKIENSKLKKIRFSLVLLGHDFYPDTEREETVADKKNQ